MGTSTVSGPFRSQNGFQELVNGVWTPVGGGGGGNPNDIVVTQEITAPADWYGGNCFSIDTGVSAQTIQDSLASNGKWACFSGYEFTLFTHSGDGVSPSYRGWIVYEGNNTQIANCVAYESCGGGYYCLGYWRSDCGSFGLYPETEYSPNGVGNAGRVGNYCALGYPTLNSCGMLATGVYCGSSYGLPSGNSLACPMNIFVWMTGAGQCGNPLPLIKAVVTLKFNNFTAF
jgi:hypothetical protein